MTMFSAHDSESLPKSSGEFFRRVAQLRIPRVGKHSLLFTYPHCIPAECAECDLASWSKHRSFLELLVYQWSFLNKLFSSGHSVVK